MHAFLMIFFMVNLTKIMYSNVIFLVFDYVYSMTYLLILKDFLLTSSMQLRHFSATCIDDVYKSLKSPHSYKKVIIRDPFNNRSEIARHGNRLPGVYMFQDNITKAMFVGGAVNLYSRSSLYLFPSVICAGDGRIYNYFQQYGYENLTLIFFILPPCTTMIEIIQLEQFIIENLEPEMNIIGKGMSHLDTSILECIDKTSDKKRGLGYYIFDSITMGLLYHFDSIQHSCDKLNMHRKMVNTCIKSGDKFIGRFIFSTEYLKEFSNDYTLSLMDLQLLFEEVRINHKPIEVAAKELSAENVLHPNLSKNYESIGEFARSVKGDSEIIRKYVNGVKPGLYRKQWRLRLRSEIKKDNI